MQGATNNRLGAVQPGAGADQPDPGGGVRLERNQVSGREMTGCDNPLRVTTSPAADLIESESGPNDNLTSL